MRGMGPRLGLESAPVGGGRRRVDRPFAQQRYSRYCPRAATATADTCRGHEGCGRSDGGQTKGDRGPLRAAVGGLAGRAGRDRQAGGRYRLGRARRIIALGDIATGLVAIGGVAIGLFSVGDVAIGLVAVGAVAIGPVALGAVSVGLVAVGAMAIGLTAMGASRPVLSWAHGRQVRSRRRRTCGLRMTAQAASVRPASKGR
jgi:hypothetical protein